MMEIKIPVEWKNLLNDEFSQPYFGHLMNFVESEYASKSIYPPQNLIFRAFNMTLPEEIKVVILGQDPYHSPGMAHGLCFSVPFDTAVPKSLINIYKEIQSDTGRTIPEHGNLERWSEQGVFLLNAALTVEAAKPLSHQKSGWLTFTDSVIEVISEKFNHVVFMLWGNFAKQKSAFIDPQRHLILTSVHPSPLSAHRGFFGCKHFSKANQYLTAHNKTPIQW